MRNVSKTFHEGTEGKVVWLWKDRDPVDQNEIVMPSGSEAGGSMEI